MTTQQPTIEFFEGIPEDLKTVKFKHDRSTGAQKIIMAFAQLRSLERLQSFTKSSSNVVRLTDTEGVITISPSATRIAFGGPEGDDVKGLEVEFELDRPEHLDRFKRFMDRYAAENDMAYSDRSSS
jgi:photosystem II Psb28-2 protein